MSNKESEDFYRGLSRKELQSLCKRHGLPARKSSSQMAESLFSYSQKKNISFAGSRKSIGGNQEVLPSPSSLKTLPSSFKGHATEDSCKLRSYPREEGNKGTRQITNNPLESCTELRVYDKEYFGGSIHYFQGASRSQFVSQCAESYVIHNQPCSGRIEHTPLWQCRCVNEGECFKENISSIRSSTKGPPSFEFYASSEEGIKLCVDLSSSPLDWIKKYKNKVSLSKNVDTSKPESLHQELGHIGQYNKQIKSSSPQVGDSAERISDGHLEAKPSPSLDMEEDNIGIDLQEGINKPLMLLPSRTYSEVLVEDSDCLREDLGPLLSKPDAGVRVQIISNTELCNSATLASDITYIPTEDRACNFFINSISDGSVDLVAIENHNSTYEDGVHENSILRNNSNPENNCVTPQFLTSCSTEVLLSETGSYHNGEPPSPDKNGELLNQDDSKHNLVVEHTALTTSSGNDHSESHLAAYNGDREWSNFSFGRESSVCSQVDNIVGKTGFRSSNLELKEKLQKKRSAIDHEVQNGYSMQDTKILRSLNHSAGEDFPRRSMRLVSK